MGSIPFDGLGGVFPQDQSVKSGLFVAVSGKYRLWSLILYMPGYYYKLYTEADMKGKLLYAHMSKTGHPLRVLSK
eukprot:1007102-Amphidinium_carterae.2